MALSRSTWGIEKITSREILQPTVLTKRRGRVVGTPASYSVGFWFKFRPGDRLS
jgi:hypothetical protein